MNTQRTYAYQVDCLKTNMRMNVSPWMARMILSWGYFDPAAVLAHVDQGHDVSTSSHVVRRVREAEIVVVEEGEYVAPGA